MSAPGELKVDDCPLQKLITRTDEKALVAISEDDTKIIACLRYKLLLWINWNKVRENGATA